MSDKNKTPIINAVGLTKTFADFWFWKPPKARAVDDIDFEIHEGEIVGLLGPNGSGKSTTVKMLLGLLYPTAGHLSVFGRSPRDVDSKKRIGYLPEESYLYKYLTASETLDFFGALFNLSSSERKSRTEQLLDMVGLSHAKNRPVGEFSKGMARRIGLAQAMINDPALLILDEPTSGLDPLGTREVKDLIMLLKKRGKTVVVTSHLLSDVEDICDRVIILYGGKIRATGTLGELLTIPNASTITTPAMTPEVTEKVLRILRENLSGEEFSIESPKKSLEDFFLEVINTAQNDNIATSGVVSGGDIADYLKDDSKSEDILNELLEPREDERQEEPSGELDVEKQIKTEVRNRKLQDLSSEQPSDDGDNDKDDGDNDKIEDSQPEQKKEMAEVNKKLEKLLDPTRKTE